MLTITPIPAFNDNYFWLITLKGTQDAYIVDPGDGQIAHNTLIAQQLKLKGILVTHRHNDHIGGIDFLLEHYQSTANPIPVYGPDSPPIPQVTHRLFNQDSITLFTHYHFTVLEIPGHTRDHIAYFSKHAQKEPVLFVGDTLFAAGCGRLFDGSAEQLYHSLSTLASLPENTQVYCAHEYTLSNLAFALAVEPDNKAITQRIKNEQAKREHGLPTIPFSLSIEKQTNPFIRISEPSVHKSIAEHWGKHYVSESELFADLRRWKDGF
ncbi:MAG: hydroxyacylglutathione hydrolase [Kiritimatiellia bacterium]|jgi:hydroxyacylglutathione hydrolase